MTESGRLDSDGPIEYIGLSTQSDAVGDGWSQARYHSDEGESVARFLSFDSVFEINPFEVGASHAAERRAFAKRRREVLPFFDIAPLARRAFASLSNGEMRRVLFARALLKSPSGIVMSNPFAGLDARWRGKFREAMSACRRRGIAIRIVKDPDRLPPGKKCARARRCKAARASGSIVLKMSDVSVTFGGKRLFDHFSWTVREGERWLLKGPNGSGKTTLLALITGDAPLSYAFDIELFGKRRGEPDVVLANLRARIAQASATEQAYSGASPFEQLDASLREGTRLLLLDEPCCNLTPRESERFLAKVEAWLNRHPQAACICVAHRPEQVPSGFTHVVSLPAATADSD